MPKKGENIYKRKDGRWEGRYIKAYRPDGKAQYSYAASLVLQQERFEHRVPHPEVVEKIFSEVLKISRIFRFGGHCILKNANLSTGCYSIMGQNMGQTVLSEIAEMISELFNPKKARKSPEILRFQDFLWLVAPKKISQDF